jgi:hypothetical protein
VSVGGSLASNLYERIIANSLTETVRTRAFLDFWVLADYGKPEVIHFDIKPAIPKGGTELPDKSHLRQVQGRGFS